MTISLDDQLDPQIDDGARDDFGLLEEGKQDGDPKREESQPLRDRQQQIDKLLGYAEQDQRPGCQQPSLRGRGHIDGVGALLLGHRREEDRIARVVEK